MSALPAVAVGDAVPARTVTVTRADLVRYAEASGDDNPIHQDEDAARAVGLPGVIAHGMLTMALAAQFVADWAGGSDAVRSFSARFTRPVVVPDDGAAVEFGATVKAVDDDGSVTLAVTATGPDGKGVLGKALARCAPRS